jgi:hypothetical protein
MTRTNFEQAWKEVTNPRLQDVQPDLTANWRKLEQLTTQEPTLVKAAK